MGVEALQNEDESDEPRRQKMLEELYGRPNFVQLTYRHDFSRSIGGHFYIVGDESERKVDAVAIDQPKMLVDMPAEELYILQLQYIRERSPPRSNAFAIGHATLTTVNDKHYFSAPIQYLRVSDEDFKRGNRLIEDGSSGWDIDIVAPWFIGLRPLVD